MKRSILLSLALVVAIGAGVMGATGAFFSDTETSTGNRFTAGDIDLQIDNESYVTDVNGRLVFSQGTSWAMSNLTNQLFFNFTDVKPGDIGEDTISIHAGSNNAWACMALDVTATPENTLVDPETGAGDAGPALGDNGELQNFLNFTFWKDDGDNVYEVGENIIPTLNNVPAATLQGEKHTIADSGTGTPLTGGQTYYVAKAWCFGTSTPNAVAQDGIGHTGTGVGDSTNGPLIRGTGFTCSGAGNQNIAQTDGILMDVSFEAVQSRNNGQFLCNPPVQQETATVTLDKIVTFSDGAIGGVDVTDYTLHLVGPGGDHILVDEVAFPGLTPGAYVVSEVYSGDPAGVTSSVTFSGSCTEIGTTDTATLNVVAGVNPVCTITNSVSLTPG